MGLDPGLERGDIVHVDAEVVDAGVAVTLTRHRLEPEYVVVVRRGFVEIFDLERDMRDAWLGLIRVYRSVPAGSDAVVDIMRRGKNCGNYRPAGKSELTIISSSCVRLQA